MAKAQEVYICFIGDSFVNGACDPGYLGWVGRLCQLSSNEKQVITNYNLGVRGDTSIDISQRWHNECEARLPQCDDPRLVFSFGVNDTVMQSGKPRVPFSRSIEITSALLSEASKRYPTLMIGPPPIDDPEQNERIKRLDAAFEKMCQANRLGYLSIYQNLLSQQPWLDEVSKNDGSHPNAAGYAQWAKLIHNWDGWWFTADDPGTST